jgi:uncharacterized SAM-binding protein YcdF (DUF218 family)
MIPLKGVLVTLALPPVSLLLLLIVGVLFAGRHRRTGRALIAVAALGLAVLSLPAVSGSMVIGLGRGLPVTPPAKDAPEAIVILGGDLVRTTEPPYVAPGLLTLDRLRAGAALHRKTGLPILVSGGIVQLDRPTVAEIMAQSLREDFQVPVQFVEDRSSNTWQNASFSAEILGRQGIHSVYVVSQAWHLRRAVLAFQHTGLIVTAVPTLMNPPIELIPSDFIPHASAWAMSYFALHEWIGYAWYELL